MNGKPYLLANTVARAMTKHLEVSNTHVHWVQVVGESRLEPKYTKPWPVDNMPMFSLLLQEGNSEGVLVYVCAQIDRYKPQNIVPILQIKMLTTLKKVGAELSFIYEVLDRIDELPLEGVTQEEVTL